MFQHDVYVSGMGIICQGASNIIEFEQKLRDGEPWICKKDNIDSLLPQLKVGAFYEGTGIDELLLACDYSKELKDKIKKLTRKLSIPLQATVMAVADAVISSGILTNVPKEKIAIVVAGSNLKQDMQCTVHERYRAKKHFVIPDYANKFWDTYILGIISEIFDIHGEGVLAGGASASGNLAIHNASRIIKSGDADACIVVGPMSELSEYELSAFANLGALGGLSFLEEPEKACRPFDKRHEGFIYGQAAGCIVLENLHSLQERGKKGCAELLGSAVCIDGCHSTNANAEGEARVMRQVLEKSGIIPNEVDYINAHGTSTPSGDVTELKAIQMTFQDKCPVVNSTKCMSGHCLCSAGIIEAIASVIQLEKGFIHGNVNLQEAISDSMNLAANQSVDKEIKIALSNSFGFAGINSCILLKKVEG